MSLKPKNQYTVLDSFVLRTPLFPFKFYSNFFHNEELELQNILSDPIFKEALYLASPSLLAQVSKWENGSLTDPKKIDRLKTAIVKYITRISTRCTPFGLFAGCTSGFFGDENDIILAPINHNKRVTRYDFTFLSQLSQYLIAHENVRNALIFYPNTSLYRIADHYRYVEYTIENDKRRYSLEGIRAMTALDSILENASNGITIKDLITLILDDDISIEDAQNFINELIACQVLVSEFELTVTGPDYFQSILSKIAGIPNAEQIHDTMLSLHERLQELDGQFGNALELYDHAFAKARQIVPSLSENYLFQVDAFINASKATLDKNLQTQLKKAFTVLNKMTIPSSNGYLENFKARFLSRFETQEIPLTFALDPEAGLGYGTNTQDQSDLLKDVAHGLPNPKKDMIALYGQMPML